MFHSDGGDTGLFPGPAIGGLTDSALYRAVLDALPDVTIWAFGEDLRCVLVSGAAVSRLGWTPDDFLGRLPSEVLGADDGACFERHMRAALSGETRYHEMSGIRHQGSVWASTIGPLTDGSGRTVGAVVVTRDIGDLRGAQEARRRFEERAARASRRAHSERWERERAELLARIDHVIAESRDRQQLIRAVAESSVPHLGDWCGLYVGVDRREGLPLVHVAHADPRLEDSARRVQELFPHDPAGLAWMERVARTGRPEVHPLISHVLLEGIDVPPEDPHALPQLALPSSIVVPLSNGDRVTGVMELLAFDGERRYGDDDLALAEAVAERVAWGLDNVRLVEIQREMSATLQRSLLPGVLPAIPGVEIAVRYWAAGEGREVGGDFYDVFGIDGERYAVVIGDVCGKGPGAAAVTGQVRHTIRAHAWRGEGPRAVLRHLNAALLRSEVETLCTVSYGVLTPSPAGATLTIACAGQELPVLVSPEGGASVVGKAGLILGAFEELADQDHSASTVRLSPGDTLVLFTDGVGDLRPPKGLEGDALVRLVSSAVAGAPSAESAADRLARALDAHQPFPERDDDVALLIVRVGAAGG